MRAWPLAVLLIAGCAVPTPTPARPLAAPSPPTTTVVLATATAAPNPTVGPRAATPIPASIATLAPPRPTPTPTADPNRGVVFGKPVALTSGGRRQVAALVTNTGPLAKTIVVKATYKQGDRIAATAEGSVTDLLPSQTRAVLLVGSDPIPAAAESVRLDVDAVVNEGRPRAAASSMRFGPVHVGGTVALPSADVEVTNGDEVLRGLVVQAVFLRGGELIGVGTGSITDLAPRQTRTVSLVVEGSTDGHDRALVAVDGVVR